jgi:hypothetical protein
MNNTDRSLLIATYIILIVYNLIFALGIWFPGLPVLGACFELMSKHQGTLTFLELLGALTIFVEMVLNFDAHKGAMKNLKFIAKLFLNYMDSALLQ